MILLANLRQSCLLMPVIGDSSEEVGRSGSELLKFLGPYLAVDESE